MGSDVNRHKVCFNVQFQAGCIDLFQLGNSQNKESCTSISADRHIFHSTVSQVDTGQPVPILEEGEGTLVILRLFKQSRFWYDNPRDFTQDGEPTLVDEEILLVQRGPAKFIAERLLRMGVPPEEHEAILLKFLQKYLVDIDDITHYVLYTVNILDISVSLLGSADYHEIVDWAAEENIVFEDHWGTNKLKFIPASRSWIKSLKKIKLDTLEVDLGSCAICLDDVAKCDDQLVTTLPCKHHIM
ncbi:uncharacterized protein LOC133715852 isoform X2 [Rosa rugosa]|uniref:uncharacterized protein LOC133715852 isoform X2 n=1 Tax=Rosa rugosa TaxID=74645 RepID=UPI002B4075A9|nr:uncharacterized protein LOC133715852 isoform X2 [Rosa rugosa]